MSIYREPKYCDSAHCDGETEFAESCGAYVCATCDKHIGLTRCYCGWSESGGDGYQELLEMGETIEDDY
jgi:hypothetical protein